MRTYAGKLGYVLLFLAVLFLLSSYYLWMALSFLAAIIAFFFERKWMEKTNKAI